jgi:hypothetical protein
MKFRSNEENSSKKEKQVEEGLKTDRLETRQAIERAVQANNPLEVWELVLYLSARRTYRKQLADWSRAMAKGKSKRISKMGLKVSKAPMLQLQHKKRGNGGRSLQKNVKRRRRRVHRTIRKG